MRKIFLTDNPKIMEKSKNASILAYFLFMLVSCFIVVATFSRYPGFEVSNRGLLVGAPVVAVIITALWYFYNKRTGRGGLKLFRPESKGVAFFVYLLYAAVYAFLIISTLLRFDIINISETTLYLISLGVGVATAICYLILASLKKK